MKYVVVGDPHVTKANLEESARVMAWARKLAVENKAAIIFMGDQYNDMGVARAEVLEFWHAEFDVSPETSIALIGNHDLNSDASASPMKAHSSLISTIGDCACQIRNGLWGVGFIRDNEKFLSEAHRAAKGGAKILLAHAEFDGAQFDNGYYSPHGIPVSGLPEALTVISGHIHKRQTLGPVYYVGTPRQMTRSDIGEEKGIHLLDTETMKIDFIATPATVAKPFRQVEIGPETDLKALKFEDPDRCFVDIRGPAEFIKKAMKVLPEQAKVRTYADSDRVEIAVKESDGMAVAFEKYLSRYFEAEKLTKEQQQAIRARVYELCPFVKEDA